MCKGEAESSNSSNRPPHLPDPPFSLQETRKRVILWIKWTREDPDSNSMYKRRAEVMLNTGGWSYSPQNRKALSSASIFPRGIWKISLEKLTGSREKTITCWYLCGEGWRFTKWQAGLPSSQPTPKTPVNQLHPTCPQSSQGLTVEYEQTALETYSDRLRLKQKKLLLGNRKFRD